MSADDMPPEVREWTDRFLSAALRDLGEEVGEDELLEVANAVVLTALALDDIPRDVLRWIVQREIEHDLVAHIDRDVLAGRILMREDGTYLRADAE